MSGTTGFQAVLEFFRQTRAAGPGDPDYDRAFCRCLAGAASAEAASIWRLDAQGFLHLSCSTDLDPGRVADISLFVSEKVRRGEGITGAAALSGQTIAVFDAQTTPQHDRRMDERTGFRTRSMVSSPILHAGVLYGTVNILNHASAGAFPPEWRDLLSAAGLLYGASLAAAGRVASAPEAKKVAKARALATPSATTVVGISLAIREALALCRKIAASDVPVIIMGETGTGKELAARRIHEEGPRSGKAFLKVNCAALSETLLESELFGHVKGAFTGAERDREGKFLAASGGTLFLDEIGEMSPSCQAKILRALEEKTVTPVGSDEPLECDTRVVAATNRDLWAEVERGAFRKDLYFRLADVEIRMPPLRERIEDIPLLAAYFLEQAQTRTRAAGAASHRPLRISDLALETLSRSSWPGNVRQLEGAVLAAATVCEGDEIQSRDFPPSLFRTASLAESPSPRPAHPDDSGNTRDQDRERYVRALETTRYPGTRRYNLAAAARELGIPRKTFAFQLKRMGILE